MVRQARKHPSTTEQLTRGKFTSRQAGYRRVAKLRKRKKLRIVGSVMLQGNGRPADVYCNGWRPSADTLEHEVLLTEFLLPYEEFEIERGYGIDEETECDAKLHIGKRVFFVEFDNGTMTYRRIESKWKRRYSGVVERVAKRQAEAFLLVVTTSEKRMQGLMEHSDAVASIALFTTLERVVADPWGLAWEDTRGRKGRLPQPGQRG